mgnify:FL=1
MENLNLIGIKQEFYRLEFLKKKKGMEKMVLTLLISDGNLNLKHWITIEFSPSVIYFMLKSVLEK